MSSRASSGRGSLTIEDYTCEGTHPYSWTTAYRTSRAQGAPREETSPECREDGGEGVLNHSEHWPRRPGHRGTTWSEVPLPGERLDGIALDAADMLFVIPGWRIGSLAP